MKCGIFFFIPSEISKLGLANGSKQVFNKVCTIPPHFLRQALTVPKKIIVQRLSTEYVTQENVSQNPQIRTF